MFHFASGNYMKQLANGSDQLYELNDTERVHLQKTLVLIYQDIAEFCDKHGLCVMLGGGSALGAVRHRGFIPWDDDLDVMMPRRDYEVFLKLFAKEYREKYIVYAPVSSFEVTNLFAKVIKRGTSMIDLYNFASKFYKGIYIDIFPIEHAPSTSFLRGVKGFISNAIAYLSVSNYMFKYKNGMFKRFVSINRNAEINYNFRIFLGCICSIVPYRSWYRFFDRFVQGSKGRRQFSTIPTGRKHYNGELLHSDVFYPPSKGEFEGVSVYLPQNVDAYLKNLYGDYMTVPPVEKRERHYYIEVKLDSNDGF